MLRTLIWFTYFWLYLLLCLPISLFLLESGHSLTIFPEGTRSKGGPVKEFKAGAFRIASRAGVPVVPVTIDGSKGGPVKEFKAGAFRIASRAGVPVVPVTIDGSFRLMEGNGMKIRPASVHVTIHPPIATKGIAREDLRALPHTVRDTIASELAS